jgi:hypothetical protein
MYSVFIDVKPILLLRLRVPQAILLIMATPSCGFEGILLTDTHDLLVQSPNILTIRPWMTLHKGDRGAWNPRCQRFDALITKHVYKSVNSSILTFLQLDGNFNLILELMPSGIEMAKNISTNFQTVSWEPLVIILKSILLQNLHVLNCLFSIILPCV